MIALKLYPIEFAYLYSYVSVHTQEQRKVELQLQLLDVVVLLEYQQTLIPKLTRWQLKRKDRQHVLQLKVSHAMALYSHLKAMGSTDYDRMLLARLDHAIVNYPNPYANNPNILIAYSHAYSIKQAENQS